MCTNQVIISLFLLICLTGSALSQSTSGGTSMTDLEENRILSRQRRFFFPDFNSTWTFVTRFSISFPLEGWDAKFDGAVPFVTLFDANE